MKLVSGLSTGQVLQRFGSLGATASILGTSSDTGPVLAKITGPDGVLKGWKMKTVGRAADGKFTALLKGIPAGGPYRLELRAGKGEARVKSFFVGDVWVLAGQSNMEGCGLLTGAAKPHPMICAFSLRREWRAAMEPLHILPESPDSCRALSQCSREDGERLRRRAVRGTGAGLYFAREMFERSGVPQALLCVAHGGTSTQQWDPALKKDGGASFYGSMLLSIQATGQPVAGLLWYQGEADAEPADAPFYTERMKKLVAATRSDLRQPGLPWVIVQLARVFGRNRKSEIAAWNSIQDQQRLLPGKIHRLDVVAAIDLPLDDPIHIGGVGFPRLGARLARAADRLVYGNRKEPPAPQLKSIDGPLTDYDTQSPILFVRFSNVQGGLRSSGEPGGFSLVDACGDDTRLLFKTTLHGDTARLHLLGPIPPGLFLSHGHDVNPVCNIMDGRGMPIPVFGPLRLAKGAAYLPYITRWRKTGVIPDAPRLAKMGVPQVPSKARVKDFGDESIEGFVNNHTEWIGKSGRACFAARAKFPEAMRLEVLCGYDGPFRLWIDGKPVFAALRGTNPCLPDEGCRKIFLSAGWHDFDVAMDINNGMAWGFFLRFRRLDVPYDQIDAGDYAKPFYSA